MKARTVLLAVIFVCALVLLFNVNVSMGQQPLPLVKLASMTNTGNEIVLSAVSGQQLNLASNSYYVVVGVAQGQGQICAQDLTQGSTATCTQTTNDVQVQIGDILTFSAQASGPFQFQQFQVQGVQASGAQGCTTPTSCVTPESPFYATIVAPMSGQSTGSVNAYFSASNSVTSTSTAVTSSSVSVVTPSVTSLGEYTQDWIITYANGEVFNVGPSQAQALAFVLAEVGTTPTYNPSSFWTVEDQVPVTYGGGLVSSGSCVQGAGSYWDSAIITATATISLTNIVQLSTNGQSQPLTSLTLGTVDALGIAWNPCSGNLVPNSSQELMDLWITNDAVYGSLSPAVQPFAFDLQAAMTKAGLVLGQNVGFYLSVTITPVVSTFYNYCWGSPSLTGQCSSTQIDSKVGQPNTFFTQWSPPVGLTTQATTTQTAFTPPYSLGCTGATCSLMGTNTQTHPATSYCVTSGSTTQCLSQGPATVTNTQTIIVTQSVPPQYNATLCTLIFGTGPLGQLCNGKGFFGAVCALNSTLTWLCQTWFLLPNWQWVLLALLLAAIYLIFRESRAPISLNIVRNPS